MPQLPLINKEQEIQKVAQVIRAINHPVRKRILTLLAEKHQAIVTEIYCCLRLEQSVTSAHLKILRTAKIVDTERKGRAILYRVNYNNLSKLERIVSEIVTEIVSD